MQDASKPNINLRTWVMFLKALLELDFHVDFMHSIQLIQKYLISYLQSETFFSDL